MTLREQMALGGTTYYYFKISPTFYYSWKKNDCSRMIILEGLFYKEESKTQKIHENNRMSCQSVNVAFLRKKELQIKMTVTICHQPQNYFLLVSPTNVLQPIGTK